MTVVGAYVYGTDSTIQRMAFGLDHFHLSGCLASVTLSPSQNRTPTFCTNMSSSLKWGFRTGQKCCNILASWSSLAMQYRLSVSWKCYETGFTSKMMRQVQC
ncbi:hypothetical protein JHK85_037380 [Glycine max]|uniref:Uncharacterized protein n=1 Tax=Glycine soja TaxID=3848 RepID=A0A0B2PQR9_GLYSO|nr:hypothetical protein JHK85_037380 [Glycine max]KHN10023.1 hypothetical protein glysoja_026923 [Glycine soja]